MIYLPKEEIYIRNPEQFETLTTKLKNWLRENMRLGRVIIEIPEEYAEDHDRKLYKAKFLFDFLAAVYPENNKSENYEIIRSKFHMFFKYRQFSNLLNQYAEKKFKYPSS